MLNVVRVTKKNRDLEAVKALYESAFPENEKRDFGFLLKNSEDADAALEMLAVYDDALFVGFVVMLNSGDISHILYFAVNEALRGKSYGSRILQTIHNRKPAQRIVADVEKPDCASGNQEQREKRIRFYHRNGYKTTEIEYRWQDEDYLILSYNGDVSKAEYAAFWKQCSGILQKSENEINGSLGNDRSI